MTTALERPAAGQRMCYDDLTRACDAAIRRAGQPLSLAVVVDVKPVTRRLGSTVVGYALLKQGHHGPNAEDCYATLMVGMAEDNRPYFAFGHYDMTLQDAKEDLANRVRIEEG